MIAENDGSDNGVPNQGDDARTPGSRPSALPVNEAGIPDELKCLRQWVCWRYEWRENEQGEAKWTKPPFNSAKGYHASHDKPSTWTTYQEAIAAYHSGEWGGIGFVFTAGDAFAGLDLDDCRKPETGVINAKAQAIIDEVDSYTEVSPSGTGVKILVAASLPAGGRKCHNFEMYDRRRYFTLTGQHVEGTPWTIEERGQQVRGIYERAFGPATGDDSKTSPHPRVISTHAGVDAVDGDALWRQVATRLKAYQRELGAGKNAKWSGEPYHSESEADMALVCALADQGLDEDEVVATFFATPRGDMAVERYGEGEAYRKIAYSAGKAVVSAEPTDDEPPVNVTPIRPELPDASMAGEIVSRPPSRFTLLTGDAIINQPPPLFLVDGMLVESTLSAMIGKEATFKSFIALDMALSIATGLPFQGQSVTRGDVVYIAGEGGGGIGKRMSAWTLHHGCAMPDTFHLLPEAVHFLQDADVRDVFQCLERLPAKPKLIVVDTLARAIQGGDENSARDMGSLISACDSLRTRYGAHVLLVHHV